MVGIIYSIVFGMVFNIYLRIWIESGVEIPNEVKELPFPMVGEVTRGPGPALECRPMVGP